MQPALLFFATALVTLFCPSGALGNSTLQRNAVIVTATRLLDDSARLPAAVTVLTAEDISRSPAHSLPEILALEAGVSLRSLYGNHAVRSTLDIRGFGATSAQNTLILLDGRRLNDLDLSAVDFASLPRQNIERIEIIRGDGGVLYGDGAVGGAINVITKQAGRAGTSGNVTLTAESHQTRRFDAAITHGQGEYAVNTSASWIDSDGYRRNNALEQTNLQADWRIRQERAEWFFQFNADDQSLRLPGERRVEPGAGIDELSQDRRGTSRPRDYADQAGFSLVAGKHHFLDADKEMIVDAGLRRKNQKAFFDDYAFGGMFANYVDTILATASLTPRFKSRHNLFGHAGEANLGVDYYHSQYDSNRSLNPSTASMPIHRLDVSQTSVAIYGQNTSDVSEHAALTTGVRWQRVTMEAHDAFDSSAPGGAFGSGAPDRHSAHNEHMLNLGIRRRLNKSWSVYAKAARSVRFATVDEFFQTDPNNFLQTFSPLEPQTGESIDLGADFAYGETRFDASIFHMNLRNEIHFNPTTFANENLDPTRRRGLTLSAVRKLSEDTRVSANYGYTRAAFREGAFAGKVVPLVSTHTGSLSMIWQVSHGLVFSAAARYTGNKRFDNDQTNAFSKIPSYSTVDIKLMGELRPWNWQAGINNLLNKEAFDYGIRSTSSPNTYNAYPLPERNLAVSLGRFF